MTMRVIALDMAKPSESLVLLSERPTPACAGLSSHGECVQDPAAVHPRVRGALEARYIFSELKNGPSPRARGSPIPFPSPHRPRCRSARPSRCPRTGTIGCPRPSGAWRGWDEQGSYVRSPSPTHLLSRGQAQKSQPENLAPADPVDDRLGDGFDVIDDRESVETHRRVADPPFAIDAVAGFGGMHTVQCQAVRLCLTFPPGLCFRAPKCSGVFLGGKPFTVLPEQLPALVRLSQPLDR